MVTAVDLAAVRRISRELKKGSKPGYVSDLLRGIDGAENLMIADSFPVSHGSHGVRPVMDSAAIEISFRCNLIHQRVKLRR